MKDEAGRIARLAEQSTIQKRMVQAMWETYCYRASRQVGYLITAPEREHLWPGFATAFTLLTKHGRTPLEAMDDYYALAMGIAAQEEPSHDH